jgi:ABC-type transporter Mla MlaB component
MATLKFEQSMTVRITKNVDSGITVLHVDGWLRSEDVSALNSEYRELTGPVALELSQLQSADATGVAALLEIASLGAELRGVSGYVKLLLSQRGRDHPET